MGASFRTWFLPGAHGAAATDLVMDWLERRGFELDESTPLFDTPSDDERGAIVASDERWTIVLLDRRDEQDRLAHELLKIRAPLVEAWVYDSDEWGYRLVVDGAEVESFDTTEGAKPSAQELCRIGGLAGREGELQRVFGEKRVFTERTLLRFVRLLGVPGAAFDYYDWIGADGAENDPVHGYTVARLRFRRPGPRARVDLHSSTLPRRLPRADDSGARGPGMPAEVAFQFAMLKTLFLAISLPIRLLFFLLQPLLMLVGRWKYRKVREAIVARARTRYVTEGQTVTLPRHQLSFELPEGVTVAPVAIGPSLLAVELGGLRAELHSVRPENMRDALAIAADAQLEEDECYFAGELPARGLFVRAERRDAKGRVKPQWVARELVDAGPAVYELVARADAPIAGPLRHTLRAIVQSVRHTS